MLSKTTRDAIALLDTLVGPQQLEELTNRVREAITHIPRGDERQGMVEESYLRTALALCLARSTDPNQHFMAVTCLEDVVEAEAAPNRLRMLARYYQAVIRLAGHYPVTQDSHEISVPPSEVLLKLAEQFQEVMELAIDLKEHIIAALCASLAAECLLRGSGDQIRALELAGSAELRLLCLDPKENTRMITARKISEFIMASGGCSLPPPMDFTTLLYEQGELLQGA